MSITNKSRLFYSAALLIALFTLPGCEFIGDVFKAGIWVGIIIIIAIIAVIVFIVRMFKS